MPALRALGPALLILISIGACKRGPDPDEPVSYVLRSKDLGLIGATITIEGKPAIFGRERYNANEDVASVRLSVPRSAPPLLDSLSVELSTPCGPKAVTLTSDLDTARETTMRDNGAPVQAMLTPSAPVPASRAFWTDADAGAVTVGKAALANGDNRIFDLGCAGTAAPIAVAGRELGPVPAFDERPGLDGAQAVFVAARPDVCYRYSQVVYARAGANQAGFTKQLAGSQIHLLSNPEVQHFLRAASGSSNVEHASYELVVTPCKP